MLCSHFSKKIMAAVAVTYPGTSAQPILEPLMLLFWIFGTWTANRVKPPTLRSEVRRSTCSSIEMQPRLHAADRA